MATVNPPRGMRDFLPAEKARREQMIATIRDRYRRHGFDEIETPVVEDWERLHAGIGGDNEKLSFDVLRRGLSADVVRDAADDPAALADLGLRYDLTVPLARFYASHRADLPAVFRALQIAPVWRAERPQKGRYRQFVQADIDVIGDPGARAEVELLVATLDAIEALGLSGASVRVNDRRLLDAMLDRFGFDPAEHDRVLVTVDKLDKIGRDGIVAELRERSSSADAVDALESFVGDHAVETTLDEQGIRAALPADPPDEVVADLVAMGAAVAAARPDARLVFDPFLVRGMGYYTGPVFELAHPSVPYSLGGGGRYDGMIGRFLGEEVPAVGFSLGFERLVELLAAEADAVGESIVLVHDHDVPVAELVALKASLATDGIRVRLERRPRNLTSLLARAAGDGYASWAPVARGADAATLDIRPLSP